LRPCSSALAFDVGWPSFAVAVALGLAFGAVRRRGRLLVAGLTGWRVFASTVALLWLTRASL
jgi:hypothetical protein